MTHNRQRYQAGSLAIEHRSNGPDVWVYRWRERRPGQPDRRRKQILGTKEELPSKAAARRVVEGLRLEVNSTAEQPSQNLTVAQIAEHYQLIMLAEGNEKSFRTRQVYKHQLVNVILPVWGNRLLRDVKAIAVESWLRQMPRAPGSKAKTKGVFGVLFQHAIRYEWATFNPIRQVRQGTIPTREHEVLTPIEVKALLDELKGAPQTLILLALVTGLRRGEIFGLKWEDVDFDKQEIRVERSLVDQVEGPPKTHASRKPVPISPELHSALNGWKHETDYAAAGDWVFASPFCLGEKPYWPDAILKRHVLPAAERVGIHKRIGWHTFRRTYATLLHFSGASMKTTQELLRHASPVMTLGVYVKALTEEKREAQKRVASMFFDDEEKAA